MNRPLKQKSVVADPRHPGAMYLVITDDGRILDARGESSASSNARPKFPRRPDPSILSDSIPLFYVGRNLRGFWVAREGKGCCGGLFLLRRSAIRFANRNCQSAGCAMMFLNERFELDLENQGSRLVALLMAAAEFASRCTPRLASFAAMAAAKWRTLIAQSSRALASERKHRKAIEKELFRDNTRCRRRTTTICRWSGRVPSFDWRPALSASGHTEHQDHRRRINMREVSPSEPPPCLRPSVFMVGRDSNGNWVVQDQNGARGGLFVDSAEALKFARFENGISPHAVVFVSGTLELDIAGGRAAEPQQRLRNMAHRMPRVA
jgi:hypothetical protein